MKTNLNGLALVALIIAAPGFSAEPDSHAGHHPAPSTSMPAVPPRAEAPPPGMMKGMGGDSAMAMQGMMGDPMPTDGDQHMMDHMSIMHGMSPSRMMRSQTVASSMWEHVDACIAFLKAELRITPAQTGPWEAFANRLRENAVKMRSQRSSMQTEKIIKAPLMQRLDHEERWLATGYENIHALKPLAIKLYDSLSRQQRKTTDIIIPPHLDLMQTM